MPLVYRMEQIDSPQGLWYTTEKLLKPIVGDLGLRVSSLAMDFDPEYARDGIAWFSGCSSVAQLDEWFNTQEREVLRQQGFSLVQYDTEFARDYAGHVIFSKDEKHVRSKLALPY